MGALLLERKKGNGSDGLFQRVLRIAPDNVDAHINVAGIHLEQGDRARALDAYRDASKFEMAPELRRLVEAQMQSFGQLNRPTHRAGRRYFNPFLFQRGLAVRFFSPSIPITGVGLVPFDAMEIGSCTRRLPDRVYPGPACVQLPNRPWHLAIVPAALAHAAGGAIL